MASLKEDANVPVSPTAATLGSVSNGVVVNLVSHGKEQISIPTQVTQEAKLNVTLERESHGCALITFYCSLFIFVDVARQIISYSLKYYNNGDYPMPQTILVFGAELVKLIVFVIYMCWQRTICSITPSFAYLVPSVTYAFNNNIYFLALHYTTPPLWNIFMQIRIIFTALIYKFYFKKVFTKIQWVALLMLIVAIVMTQVSKTQPKDGSQSNIVMAMVLAVVASALASIGPLYTEYLFKNDKRSFDEKQLQMYFYGSAVTISMEVVRCIRVGHWKPSDLFIINNQEMKSVLLVMVVAVVFLASIGGVATAVIMKKLDNIVKLYAQAISNVINTIFCFYLFPDEFTCDLLFIGCVILTIAAIFLYENKGGCSCDGCMDKIIPVHDMFCTPSHGSGDMLPWLRFAFFTLTAGVATTALYLSNT